MFERFELAVERLRKGAAVVALIALSASPVPAEPAVQFAEVDGTKLAYATAGMNGPVVVFESGSGGAIGSWDAVANRLGSCFRTFAYLRAGNPPSGPLQAPVVHAADVATNLRDLLTKVGLPPPYVLVGHSLGGLYVQAFARNYPHDVAAVVLVDASSPLEPEGVFVSTKPPSAGSTAAAEEEGVGPSTETLNAGAPFPDRPLIVLAATNHADTPAREVLWREVQKKTAALSPRGRLVVVESGHDIHRERPDAVADAVLDAARLAGLSIACRK